MSEEMLFTRLKTLIVQQLEANITSEAVQPDSVLFEGGLNLDSIQLIKLIELIETTFQIQFTDDELRPELFHSMTNLVQGLATKCNATTAKPVAETVGTQPQTLLLQAASHDQALPLSLTQQAAWQFQQQHPQACSSNVGLRLQLQGRLQFECLQRSFTALAQRHAILRTYYTCVDGQARQHIADHDNLQLQYEDWSQYTSVQQAAAVQNWIQTEIQQRPFDLSQPPLWRVQVSKLTADCYYLLLVIHHIQIDHFSILILLKELAQFYTAFSTEQAVALATLPLQYADYAVWQRAQLTQKVLAEKQAYWLKLLRSLPAPLKLDTQTAHATAFSSGQIEQALSPTQTGTLEQFSQQQGCNVFACVLTAFAVTLSPYSDQQGILIGSPMSNKRTDAKLKQLIGHFAGRAALVISVANNPYITTMLKHAHQVALDAFLQQDISYAQLCDLLPETSLPTMPPFQVILNFIPLNQPLMQSIATPQLNFKILKDIEVGMQTPAIVLTIGYVMTETSYYLQCLWEYRQDMWAVDKIEALAEHFLSTLNALSHSHALTLSAIAQQHPSQERSI